MIQMENRARRRGARAVSARVPSRQPLSRRWIPHLLGCRRSRALQYAATIAVCRNVRIKRYLRPRPQPTVAGQFCPNRANGSRVLDLRQSRKKVCGLSRSSPPQSTGFQGKSSRSKRRKTAQNRHTMHQNHQSDPVAGWLSTADGGDDDTDQHAHPARRRHPVAEPRVQRFAACRSAPPPSTTPSTFFDADHVSPGSAITRPSGSITAEMPMFTPRTIDAPRLDRAEPADRQVLLVLLGAVEPAVVRDVHQEVDRLGRRRTAARGTGRSPRSR